VKSGAGGVLALANSRRMIITQSIGIPPDFPSNLPVLTISTV
jgi:hypothetical protein